MKNELVFIREARRDIEKAYLWYQEQQKGLGEEYLTEIKLRCEIIMHTPQLFPRVDGEMRRARIKKFPFSIFYEHIKEQIVVFAVAHDKRDPDFWKDRY